MFALTVHKAPLLTTAEMAGHRRANKPGTRTLRARHHDNARAQTDELLSQTTDPVERLKIAYSYALGAAKRARRRDPSTDTSPFIDAQHALLIAGDSLLK